MKRKIIIKEEKQSNPADKTLKATAIFSLKEALVKEEYEECPKLIKAAKRFGVEQTVIDGLISEYIRGIINGQTNEAYENTGGHLYN